MKTLKSTLLSLSILFVFSSSFAQTYKETENTGNSYESLDKNAKLNFLSAQKVQTPSASSTSEPNSIFIQQVGNDNIFTSNTTSETSDINIIQQGDENLVHLNLTAKEIEQAVLQNGTRNSFFNISSNPISIQKTHILQDGINQDITLYGENSISENMQILMQGSDRSIIVRNFN